MWPANPARRGACAWRSCRRSDAGSCPWASRDRSCGGNFSVLGRRHVQAYDVFELLDKQRIARDLEAMNEMRLQAIGASVCRETLAALTPSSAAILRVLQCVAASAACPHDNPPISPEDAEALKQLNELVEVPE